MSLDLFKDIVGKVSTEYPGSTIALYNWTEPLLHSQVPDFIKVIHDFGLNSRLSTHLNVLPNAKGLAEANPGGITISLSGFTQKVYEIGHKDGDIETVKQNMCILSDALQKAKSTTEVSVYYHKYLHNLDEEAAMKDFSTRLGFSFGSSWAFYMPLEKVDAYIQDKMQGEEKEFLKNRFALNIKRAVDSTRPFRNEPCSIKSSSLTINCRGIVQLCCAVYDENKFSIQSYLETSSAELEKIIDQHSYCRKCMNKGLHIYSTWHGHQIAPIYEKIVQDEIEAEQTARF